MLMAKQTRMLMKKRREERREGKKKEKKRGRGREVGRAPGCPFVCISQLGKSRSSLGNLAINHD